MDFIKDTSDGDIFLTKGGGYVRRVTKRGLTVFANLLDGKEERAYLYRRDGRRFYRDGETAWSHDISRKLTPREYTNYMNYTPEDGSDPKRDASSFWNTMLGGTIIGLGALAALVLVCRKK